jgi:predicted RNA-binding Zn-ribbon protein involved in translation (DUF1610 family)
MDRRKEVLEEILTYINMTLKENNLELKDLFEDLSTCPLCHTKIIKCPFCEKPTPVDYKCHNCDKVLPLDRILEQLAKVIM